MQQPGGGCQFKHVFVCPKKFVWAPRCPTTSALEDDGEERDTARSSGESTQTVNGEAETWRLGRLGAWKLADQVTSTLRLHALRVEDKKISLIRYLPREDHEGVFDNRQTDLRAGVGLAPGGGACLRLHFSLMPQKKKREISLSLFRMFCRAGPR